jgi:hypothetical protein
METYNQYSSNALTLPINKLTQNIILKWKSINGTLAWSDIKEGCVYHCPPTPFCGRMDVVIESVFNHSIRGKLLGTNQ